MTPRANKLASRFSADVHDLRELAELEPDEATAILCAVVAELRALLGPQSLTEIAQEV